EPTRRAVEGIAKAGVQNHQVPPLEEVGMGDQVMVNPPPMTNGDIRAAFLQMSQAVKTLAQEVTTKGQVMTARANWEVVPKGNKQVRTIDSLLKDILTRMNPPSFYGSKVEEDPQELID
ncbi:hypothetical protein EJD97_018676, partial [Solanum chilense]